VTISFVPDGTVVGVTSSGPLYSNLFATMNARFGSPSVWENQILLAAQTWARQTNLNFDVVGDNATGIGQGAYQQGDPGMGDIRIGGAYLASGALAQAYLPSPLNNYSIAGDIQFNTTVGWTIGSTYYDLYSVALHEFGHALGLYHSTASPTPVMWPYYTGVVSGLAPDDAAGIQAIYGGARANDYYDTYAPNNVWYTSTDLTGQINPWSKTVLLANMDITTNSDVDWYVVQAPAGTNSRAMVLVQSWLQSQLRPAVYVYSGGALIGAGSVGSPQGGSLLVVNLSNVTPGQMIYIEVVGESNDAFGTGKYALSLNFGYGPTPSVGAYPTATPNGVPLQGGGAQADTADDDGPGHAVDSYPAAAPSAATPVPATLAPAVRSDAAAVVQVVQSAARAAVALHVESAQLVGQGIATPVGTAVQVAATLPAEHGTAIQPAPLALGSVATSPAADDEDAVVRPTSEAAPAVEPAPAKPEEAVRALPMTFEAWDEAATAYFSESAEDAPTPAPLGDQASGLALEALAAVAGILAVVGEHRVKELRDAAPPARRRPTRA
jgi:hypothetical protein